VQKTLFFRHALLPSGWAVDVRVTVANGLITAIDAGVPQAGAHGIALPGMPNLHSHTFQRAIAGLTERRGPTTDSFWTWRELMYRFALRLTPDEVEAVATHAFIEMLEGGFCAVAEFHYLHNAPDGTPYDDIAELSVRIAAAAAAAGIELRLLPVFYAQSDFGSAPPTPGQRRFLSGLDGYAKLLERCRTLAPAGVAPHSLRAVAPADLAAVIAMAAPGEPLHIHVAEQTAEVDACLAWSGARPVDWLFDHAAVDQRWCLIHSTHANAAERARIAAAGAVVGLCPLTEASLGDGIFPAHDFFAAGRIGIGTDSNVLISVAAELRQLETTQRLLTRERNVMASAAFPATATALYQATVAGGAQALGFAPGFTVGAPANFVAIPGRDPDIALSHAVFSALAPVVQTVWVHGKEVVTEGRHPLAPVARKRFESVVERLACE